MRIPLMNKFHKSVSSWTLRESLAAVTWVPSLIWQRKTSFPTSWTLSRIKSAQFWVPLFFLASTPTSTTFHSMTFAIWFHNRSVARIVFVWCTSIVNVNSTQSNDENKSASSAKSEPFFFVINFQLFFLSLQHDIEDIEGRYTRKTDTSENALVWLKQNNIWSDVHQSASNFRWQINKISTIAISSRKTTISHFKLSKW